MGPKPIDSVIHNRALRDQSRVGSPDRARTEVINISFKGRPQFDEIVRIQFRFRIRHPGPPALDQNRRAGLHSPAIPSKRPAFRQVKGGIAFVTYSKQQDRSIQFVQGRQR